MELEGETAQKEENASEKFWFFSREAIVKQDRAGVSLYQENTENEREKKEGKKREIPACNLHQPRTRRPGCAPRRPAVLPSSTPRTLSV